MGEQDESFATNAAVPSFVDSSSSTGGDANQDSFLALLVKCYYQNLLDPLRHKSVVMSMLITLVTMKLNLPENAEARESISRTNIIECLVKTMATPKLQRDLFVYAARLMGDLISGSHTENIKECYKCGALPVLVDNLSSEYGGHCAPVLKLLWIDDNPQQNAESLLDFSSVSTILNAMKARPDLHEWGCSMLHYVLAGWEKHCPGEDAGEAFLKNGAIDAILNAICRIPNATVTSGGQGPDRLGSAPAPAPAPNPAPAPKASSFNFGQAPAPAFGFTFGNMPVPAPSSIGAGGFIFGGAPAPAPSSRTGGFTIGSERAPAPAAAPASSTFFFGSTPAPAPCGTPAPAPTSSTGVYAFGSAPVAVTLAGDGRAPAPAPTSGNGGSAAKPILLPGTRTVGTAATIREACKCILILVSKSPGICSNLLTKGAVTFLGAALQKQWPKETTDVHGHCKQALLAVLGSPM